LIAIVSIACSNISCWLVLSLRRLTGAALDGERFTMFRPLWFQARAAGLSAFRRPPEASSASVLAPFGHDARLKPL
jgi:hypothetical protein